MLEEWAANNHKSSINMLHILIKYAWKERESLLQEISNVETRLKDLCDTDEFDKEMLKIENRLNKVEEEVKKKKQHKFIRDQKDYEKGQVLTFAKKYDSIRVKQPSKSAVSQRMCNEQQLTVENNEESVNIAVNSTDPESDTSESDISVQSLPEGVKTNILKEFDLLAQGRQVGQR
ncbi:hypothetical protein NDU88_004401 [Pleurodeles waltl]|uniref:Death domain-containing protein n=1 Tax=Pleurodeles waltl TaxID=8319 RepID=A0AAV7M8A4_PLEWA|nr:hypothetical protein NDU88_004401 [Pleurodeles waltl]